MRNMKRFTTFLIAFCLILTSVFTFNGHMTAYAAEEGQTKDTDGVSVDAVFDGQTEDTLNTSSEEQTETTSEAQTEAVVEDTQEDTAGLPITTYDIDASLVPITFADLVYKDADGNVINPAVPMTYSYHTNQNRLNISLYYNNRSVCDTTDKNNYFNASYYKLNPATNVYEPCSSNYGYATTPGSYRIVLTACSNGAVIYSYDGTTSIRCTLEGSEPITLDIVVTPKDINDADIVVSAIGDQTYVGTPLYPEFSVVHQYSVYDYYTLVPNITYEYDTVYDSTTHDFIDTYTPVYNDTYDYTVEYLNNSSAGQGIIRITGVGNFTGTRDIIFNIFADVSTLTYSGYKDTTYTGKNITFPGFTASEGSKVLTPGVDYSIAYSDNKKYGEATITVTGMGYYTGTYAVHFGIVPKKVTGIKASSPKKLQAKLTWNKCTGADGFEIARYNTKKKTYEVIALLGDGKWQVYQDASVSLKNNVSYKYRIRPYVTSSDGSRRYYGTAATKKCKVTKAYKELNIPIYTGCADVDYAAEVICKKVIKKGMSQQQKVKALYDWTVEHCTHDKDYGKHETVYSYSKNKKKAKAYNTKIWKQIYTGKADCNFDGYGYNDSSYNWNYYGDDYDVMFPQQIGWVNGKGQFYRTYEAFQTHKGGCSYITRLFKALINHAGLECTLVDGNFKNRDGSKMYHNWCFIRVNKKYAWYDVDIATSHKNIRYTWYKKGAKFWHTCHEWDPKENEKIPSNLN